jgi:hypothetical protein
LQVFLKEFIMIEIGEYNVHRLMRERGMKVGRAIRRLHPDITDGEVQDLATFVTDSLTVEVGDSEELFVAAYKAIKSCMYYRGVLAYKAYARHGIKIAVLRDANNTIIGRCLVNAVNDKANLCYGIGHGLLRAALKVWGGIDFTPMWVKPELDVTVKFAVRTVQVETRYDAPCYTYKQEWRTRSNGTKYLYRGVEVNPERTRTAEVRVERTHVWEETAHLDAVRR